MKSLTILGTRVEIDEERTGELYEGGSSDLDWCQCDGCTNARMQRLHSAPAEQSRLLREMGLDPALPYLSRATWQRSPRSRRHTQRLCCWFAYGRIVDAECTEVLRFDRFNSMWVDSRRALLDRRIEGMEWNRPTDPGFIYVVTFNRLPRLYGEVCGFRSERAPNPCPECGFMWRETGYLKRRSLIPEWRGVPELLEVLRLREGRVYVEFCSRCGRMEYRIVDDRPPFRRRNTLHRDALKAARATPPARPVARLR